MPPIVHCIRHAQGYHNLASENEARLSDPDLTRRGVDQCARSALTFPYHDDVEFVMASPVRRTIQTALIGLKPTIEVRKLRLLLMPRAQETSSKPSDTGSDTAKLVAEFGEKIDTTRMVDEWNKGEGLWEKSDESLAQRADELKGFLHKLPFDHVALVAHGSFLEHLSGEGGWHNTEFRSFEFPSGPSSMRETEASRQLRREKPAGGYRHELGEEHENPQAVGSSVEDFVPKKLIEAQRTLLLVK